MDTRQNHERLELHNFTAFSDVRLEFSPGINVLIGENGTGKTHLLKVLYWASGMSRSSPLGPSLFAVEAIDSTIRLGAQASRLSGTFGGRDWRLKLRHNEHVVSSLSPVGMPEGETGSSVFIPTHDALSLGRTFASAYERFDLPFDRTLYDLAVLLTSPTLRELDPVRQELLANLIRVLGGELTLDEMGFTLTNSDGALPIGLVAEGVRKVATLARLIQVGALERGSVLLWDEPEVNMNPTLMDELVAAILVLARAGVQVFLATHSYVILKELDLQVSHDDSVRYFALERHPEGTRVHPCSALDELVPNLILDQYASLYDRQISRATGRPK